jgi:phosphoribosylformylglycinamidine cyclo-ligase
MTKNDNSRGLTYADAGVDIDAGNALVQQIKPLVARTHRTGILGAIGGFGGLFELPVGEYRQPVMVSGADGVGTKLRVSIDLDMPDTVGIDLVAMCVNDILVCGAEPLWFLDYFATGKLDVDHASRVIGGIAEGCVQSGAALLGGETAEMPGMYHDNDYDLAGFAVGVIEKTEIIDGTTVTPGDAIIGLHSSGPHSNGYSLIRRVIEQHDISAPFGDSTLGETLMQPTRIYVKAVRAAMQNVRIKAMAHITGGGITENIPRSLPENVAALIDRNSWQAPAIFAWLQEHGGIADSEMLKTFNCGIGFTLVVSHNDVEPTLKILREHGEQASVIGSIIEANGEPAVTYA